MLDLPVGGRSTKNLVRPKSNLRESGNYHIHEYLIYNHSGGVTVGLLSLVDWQLEIPNFSECSNLGLSTEY